VDIPQQGDDSRLWKTEATHYQGVWPPGTGRRMRETQLRK
jgi:hypothetical protein